MKAVLLIVVLALASHVVAQSFTGQWRDNDNRVFFLCQDDQDLHGSYSEVGIIQGSVDGNEATGRLYQAIHPRDGCSVRLFTWDLDGESFRGEWECDDVNFDGNWNAVRESTAQPTDLQCARLADTGSLAGRWSYTNGVGTEDICVDDDEFISSYDFPATGTSFGEVFEDGRVLIGNYDEVNGDGWDLYALIVGDQLLNYNWDSGVDDEDVLAFVGVRNDFHRIDSATRLLSEQDNTACRRNEHFRDPTAPLSPQPNPPPPPPVPTNDVDDSDMNLFTPESPSPAGAGDDVGIDVFTIPRHFSDAPSFFSPVPTYHRTLPTVFANTIDNTEVSDESGQSRGGFVVYRSPKTVESSPGPVYFAASYADVFTTMNSVESPVYFDPNNYPIYTSSFDADDEDETMVSDI